MNFPLLYTTIQYLRRVFEKQILDFIYNYANLVLAGRFHFNTNFHLSSHFFVVNISVEPFSRPDFESDSDFL